MIYERSRSVGIGICEVRQATLQLALLASLLPLPVALRVDRGLPTREHVVRRHVPNRAVQPDMVMVPGVRHFSRFREVAVGQPTSLALVIPILDAADSQVLAKRFHE